MSAMQLELSQRTEDHGIADAYLVVVSTASDELVHEFCAYSSAYGGPVRPDPVTGLRAEQIDKGRATVRWEWSENSFDLASPGAYFERDVILDPLAWAGPVRKTPKTKPVAPAPKVDVSHELRAVDVAVKSEWRQNGCDDEWEIHVSHAATGTKLVWKGTSTAENQDIKKLRHTEVDGVVRIDFVYYCGENGSNSASDRSLFVKLGETGIEWVPKHVCSGRLHDGRCSGTL
mmetsp:Transcript_20689/g.53890  ORF Transcript_20689/g.53890 Transcript_20689/m.53890 type:complete len:231 (+) Transcript_20689:205-897(+)